MVCVSRSEGGAVLKPHSTVLKMTTVPTDWRRSAFQSAGGGFCWAVLANLGINVVTSFVVCNPSESETARISVHLSTENSITRSHYFE